MVFFQMYDCHNLHKPTWHILHKNIYMVHIVSNGKQVRDQTAAQSVFSMKQCSEERGQNPQKAGTGGNLDISSHNTWIVCIRSVIQVFQCT